MTLRQFLYMLLHLADRNSATQLTCTSNFSVVYKMMPKYLVLNKSYFLLLMLKPNNYLIEGLFLVQNLFLDLFSFLIF